MRDPLASIMRWQPGFSLQSSGTSHCPAVLSQPLALQSPSTRILRPVSSIFHHALKCMHSSKALSRGSTLVAKGNKGKGVWGTTEDIHDLNQSRVWIFSRKSLRDRPMPRSLPKNDKGEEVQMSPPPGSLPGSLRQSGPWKIMSRMASWSWQADKPQESRHSSP